MQAQESSVDQIRIFNRFYTREIGLLAEHLPGGDFTLTEARVLYELAQTSAQTAADIMRRLGMDRAHISRIVARFERAGLLKGRVSPDHGKHRLLSLTAAGKKAFQQLNQGTVSQMEALVAPLGDADRQRLIAAMRDIRRLLQSQPNTFRDVTFRAPRVGDMGWIIHRQAVLYQQEYGWDWTYEGLVAQILGEFVKSFDPKREDAWVAEMDGSLVGSVFLMKSDDVRVSKLRLLYVDSAARGLGVGSRLVNLCIQRARELGYAQLTLWTNDILVSARKIYQAAGFRLIEENPHHSFGKDLVGQTWMLDLQQS